MSWLSSAWRWYEVHSDKVNPVFAALGGSFLIGAAIWQARTATRQAAIANRQADVASRRHDEQTRADLQRRLSETYNKAVEQLASEKVLVRLGGIFTLQRLSQESLTEHRTVMETLTAFIRERTHITNLSDPDLNTPGRLFPAAASDVQAALQFIWLRREAAVEQERKEEYRINLSFSDLRGAHFDHAQLDRAIFAGSILDDIFLTSAALNGANFRGARAIGTLFMGSKLERAQFLGADITHAKFSGAKLHGTYFRGGAGHADAVVVGVDFSAAEGDEWTELPPSIARPSKWPPERS